jgi:uncharacterized protein (TIGR01244 family)
MTRPLPATQPLSETVFVAGQIRPDDVAEFADCGVTIIVNNRPDGEEADQPMGAEIEAAARAAGIDYVHIPVAETFAGEKVAAMGDALANAEGNVVIFCKSGTRSAYLWALARARQGADVDELMFHARQAGYNLRPLLPWLKPETKA